MVTLILLVPRQKGAVTQKIPRLLRGILQLNCYRKSRIRMISGIGIPTSHKRMGMGFPFGVTN
jgi:hypothetical protein